MQSRGDTNSLEYAQDSEEEAQSKAPEHRVSEERMVEPDERGPLLLRAPLLEHQVPAEEREGVDCREDRERLADAERREKLTVDERRYCAA